MYRRKGKYHFTAGKPSKRAVPKRAKPRPHAERSERSQHATRRAAPGYEERMWDERQGNGGDGTVQRMAPAGTTHAGDVHAPGCGCPAMPEGEPTSTAIVVRRTEDVVAYGEVGEAGRRRPPRMKLGISGEAEEGVPIRWRTISDRHWQARTRFIDADIYGRRGLTNKYETRVADGVNEDYSDFDTLEDAKRHVQQLNDIAARNKERGGRGTFRGHPGGMNEARAPQARERGIVFLQRPDGVYWANATGAITGTYWLMPEASGNYRVVWSEKGGNQQDLGTHPLASAMQVATKDNPSRREQDGGQRAAAPYFRRRETYRVGDRVEVNLNMSKENPHWVPATVATVDGGRVWVTLPSGDDSDIYSGENLRRARSDAAEAEAPHFPRRHEDELVKDPALLPKNIAKTYEKKFKAHGVRVVIHKSITTMPRGWAYGNITEVDVPERTLVFTLKINVAEGEVSGIVSEGAGLGRVVGQARDNNAESVISQLVSEAAGEAKFRGGVEAGAGERLTTRRRNDLPDSAFALPHRRELPIEDAAHVRAASARLSMMRHEGHVTQAEYEEARHRIIVAGHKFGVHVNESAAE